MLLQRLCTKNRVEKVREVLSKSDLIDLTEDDAISIRIAISNHFNDLLKILLEYFYEHNSDNQLSQRKLSHHVISHVDFEDLDNETLDIISETVPFLAKDALLERIACKDLETSLKILPHFPDMKDQILEESVEHNFLDLLEYYASKEISNRNKAIFYRKIADIYRNKMSLEDAYEYYKKSIDQDPTYYISRIHFADCIVNEELEFDFNVSKAREAEGKYLESIDINPRYSSSYKKLGYLYQKWAAESEEVKSVLEIKALNCYFNAMKFKPVNVRYDDIFEEIKILSSKYPEEAEEIFSNLAISGSNLEEYIDKTGKNDSDSDFSSYIREDFESDVDIIGEDSAEFSPIIS